MIVLSRVPRKPTRGGNADGNRHKKRNLNCTTLRALTRAMSRCYLPIEFSSAALTEIFSLGIFYSFLLSSALVVTAPVVFLRSLLLFHRHLGANTYYILYIFEIKEVLGYPVGRSCYKSLSFSSVRFSLLRSLYQITKDQTII